MTPSTPAPAIEIGGLRKSFGDHEVLKGIDLSVRTGEVLCVIGPSGSGKSTLLRTVNRLEEPTAGSVRIEGVDILDPDCDIARVRARIGMVFQQFNLFPHLDVLGNVTIAQRRVLRRGKREAVRTAREMLDRVGSIPRPALRGPAAARGDRPRAGDGPGADALRRAHLGPRPRAGR